MNCAVFTVVYPGVESFFPELINSLLKQTDKDFTLFVLNDGLQGLSNFLKGVDFDVQVREMKGSAALLRKRGIEWVLLTGVKQIVFVDADDYIENDRIEIVKKKLAACDIVCNEMVLFGKDFYQQSPLLEKFFEEGMEIKTNHLLNSNCMGLTNTALRADIIPKSVESIPENIIAFDWAFFAMCLHFGAKAKFTKETKTYYRQHSNNTVSADLSDNQIMRGVQVKRDHYQWLSKFYQEYSSLANAFGDLLIRLESDEAFKQKYCQTVKPHGSPVALWWEPIKLLEE